ncbi:alpha/beta hydrolase [uncultured Marivita sp.]|uniref:alpha/beta fold hydrolase n=1 Tax=uncultured Marivita sp. TaxID=888080 RepID=UPI00262B0DF5|nr:alpha/beta hydrolase [uncultured Marivita sp.]
MRLNGFDTELQSWGEGPEAVLCLHPLGQEAAFFADLDLGPGRRVLSFDQRGHGVAAATSAESLTQMVDDAEAAMRKTGARHLAGFSMGGAVAAELAARSDARSVCLAATPHEGLPVFAERACAVSRGSVAAVTEHTVQRWFGRTGPEPAIDRARASLAKMTPEGFDAAWRALASFEGYGRIAPALPPALCLAYAGDLSTPPDVLMGIAGTIRDAGGRAEFDTIPGAGHFGLLETPRETSAAIRGFLEGLE